MERKKIIQLVVIIVAFGGSGFVLYNGLFKTNTPKRNTNVALSGIGGTPFSSTSSPATLASLPTGSAVVSKGGAVLPNGNSFDIDGLFKKYPLVFNSVNYPKLNTSTDIGIPIDKLITPQLATPTGK